MGKMIRLLKFAPVTNGLLLITSLSALISIGYACDLTKSDWASWVQAVGSVIAILLTYYLFQRQRNHELERLKTEELSARARSVRVVQATGFWILEIVGECLEDRANDFDRVIIPGLPDRLDDLRSMCDSFVGTATDEVAVLCALKFGHMLAETKADFEVRVPAINDLIVNRMRDRLNQANALYAALIAHQNRLDQMLKVRGIAADTALQDVRRLAEPPTE